MTSLLQEYNLLFFKSVYSYLTTESSRVEWDSNFLSNLIHVTSLGNIYKLSYKNFEKIQHIICEFSSTFERDIIGFDATLDHLIVSQKLSQIPIE